MSNWNPKPLRPSDPNPLFKQDDSYTVKKSYSPIERQRLLDGTPHTKGGPTSLHPGNVEALVGSELVLEVVEKSKKTPALDPDAIVKSFLEKGVIGQVASAAGKIATTAAKSAVDSEEDSEEDK